MKKWRLFLCIACFMCVICACYKISETETTSGTEEARDESVGDIYQGHKGQADIEVYERSKNSKEWIIYVNGIPKTIKKDSATIEVTSVESEITDKEIIFVLPRWAELNMNHWTLSGNGVATLIESEIILDGQDYPPDEIGHYPFMQRVRVGVAKDTKGRFFLKVSDTDGDEHKIEVNFLK